MIAQVYDLPNHTNELNKLNNILHKDIEPRIHKLFVKFSINQKVDDKDYDDIVDAIQNVLYQVGELSLPFFAIRNQLEEDYFKIYKHSPKLAKKLWQDEYANLHKPYNKIKNKCFDYLDTLEEKYIQYNNKKPMIKNKITIDY